MKKTILHSIILFVICLLNVNLISANSDIFTETEENDPIDLSGNLPNNSTRSLTSLSPISIFQYQDYIEVGFNSSLGAINVSIYDDEGNVVYQQSINASAGQQLLIDVSDFDAGTYTIEFVNSQADLSGDFEI